MGLLDKFYGRGRDIFKAAIMATGLSAANPGMAQEPVEAYPPSAEHIQGDTQRRVVHSLCNTAPDATLIESLACNQSPTTLLGLGAMSVGSTQVGVGTSKKYGPGVNVSGVFLNDIGNSGAGVAVKGNKNHINATLVGGHALKYGNIIAGVSGARFDVEKGLGFKDAIDSHGTAYRGFIGVSDMRATEILSFNAYAFREHASNVRLAVEEKIVPIKWSDTSPDVTYSYSGNERQVARTNFFGNTSTGVFGDAIFRMEEGSIITRLGYKHTKNDFTGERNDVIYGLGYNHTTEQNRWNVMFNQNGDQKNITADVSQKIAKNLAGFVRAYISQSSITTDYGIMVGIDAVNWKTRPEGEQAMRLDMRMREIIADPRLGTISDAATMGTIGTVYDNPIRLNNTLEKVDITTPNPVENLSVVHLANGKYQIQFSASSNIVKPLYYMSINGKPERAITNGTIIDAEELNPEGENRIDVVVVNAPGSILAAPASANSATRTPYIARSEKRTCILVINPANKPPVANSDSITTAFGVPVSINVLSNDIDPEKATLSIGMFTQPQNGTVTRSGARLIYTPKSGFSGTDTFTYYAYDGKTNSITPATVSVTVTPEIKQPPAPTDTAETVTSGGSPTITPTSITVPPPTITDSDNPAGFNPSPILVVKDASGNVVSANSLTPDTPYTYYFTYMTYNGATNILTLKTTTPVSFRTLASSLSAPTAISLSGTATLTQGSLTVGQQIATLTCAQAEGKPCTYATTSSDVVIVGNTMQIKNASLPAGTYTIPVTATVTNEYGATKAYTQNVSVTVEAPAILPPSISYTPYVINDNGGRTTVTLTPVVNTYGTSVTYAITSVTRQTQNANSSTEVMLFSIDPSTGVIIGQAVDENQTEVYSISGTACNAGGCTPFITSVTVNDAGG